MVDAEPTCGICGKPTRDDQHTIPFRKRRTAGSFDEPPPPQQLAHAECFRQEILKWNW